jgi:hypothetical protein
MGTEKKNASDLKKRILPQICVLVLVMQQQQQMMSGLALVCEISRGISFPGDPDPIQTNLNLPFHRSDAIDSIDDFLLKSYVIHPVLDTVLDMDLDTVLDTVLDTDLDTVLNTDQI